jgi:hypothetical protein
MPSPSLRSKVVRLLLVLALTLPWSAAAAPAVESPDLLSRLWQLLASLWSDSGCHIDPDGRCGDDVTAEPPDTSNGDSGCHLDPHGGCSG